MRVEDDDDPVLDADQVFTYRSVTGLLAYTAIDRRDIQLEVNLMARQLKCPRGSGWKLGKRIVRYVSGTETAYSRLPTTVRYRIRLQHRVDRLLVGQRLGR